MSSKVDVLIIGAGPTGLTAALWMSQLGIQTRVIDKRGTRVLNGHADGIQTRTLEILNSFGLARRFIERSASFLEWCVWVPNNEGKLHRSRAEPPFGSTTSKFQAITLHQGRLESLLLEAIRERSDLDVERAIEPTSLQLDEGSSEETEAYPITIGISHLAKEDIEISESTGHTTQDGTNIPLPIDRSVDSDLVYRETRKEGTSERIQAKYLIACEGAHSWTRRQLGFVNEGESIDEFWGVIDVVPITDFPDIRKLCTIQSNIGTVLNVPREENLVRLYIQLTPEDAGEGVLIGRGAYTPANMFAALNKIIAPYTVRYTYCDWWTVFQVGRRVCNRYTSSERIFLAGDAVHTHTPKGGQGMNVSIQDAYNLGWKIGGVLKGQLPRSILKTYEPERRPVAQELIALDHDLSTMLGGKPNEAEMRRVYEHARRFFSGTQVRYDITNAKSHAKPDLAKHVDLGSRLPSCQVIRQADACICETQDLLVSDGRWRLVVMAGDVSEKIQLQRVNDLGETLAPSSGGLLKRYSASVILVILIHCARKEAQIELAVFHDTFFPFDERRGYDYDRVFADVASGLSGNESAGDAHEYYGVDQGKGCLIVTRPDQHVGYVGELDDVRSLERYFDDVLIAKGA